MKTTETATSFIVNSDLWPGPITCEDIRGAVIEPDIHMGLPGYCLFIGRDTNGVHWVLHEIEEPVMDVLFTRIAQDAESLLAHRVYTDKTRDEFFSSMPGSLFKRLHRDLKDVGVLLAITLLEDYVTEGVHLAQRYQRERILEIPEEIILYRQMKTLDPYTLDERCYAFNALALLLVGFDRQRSGFSVMRFRERRREAQMERERRRRIDELANLTGISRLALEQIERTKSRANQDRGGRIRIGGCRW
jgi:hypothetical protein